MHGHPPVDIKRVEFEIKLDPQLSEQLDRLIAVLGDKAEQRRLAAELRKSVDDLKKSTTPTTP